MSEPAGAMLRAIREAVGVTVVQVADVSGVSAGTVSRLEQHGVIGSRRSTVDAVLAALAEMATVRVAQLTGDGFAPESSHPGAADHKRAQREAHSKPAGAVLRPPPPPPTLDDLAALLTGQAGLWKAASLLLDSIRQSENHA